MKCVYLFLCYFIAISYGFSNPGFNISRTQDNKLFLFEPGANATGGTLTCEAVSIQVFGSSPTEGVEYSWTGPEGFFSNLQNPFVTVAGVYVLSVFDPVSGLTSQDMTTVNEDISPPDITATGGTITCFLPFVQLGGWSFVEDATFLWTGPEGFQSDMPNPFVSVAGAYLLMVTNPANGCVSSAKVFVEVESSIPNVTATGGTITCSDPVVQLMAFTESEGLVYTWTGPGGFTSSEQNPFVSLVGLYFLTVFDPATGCSTAEVTFVNADNEEPGVVANGGALSCSIPLAQVVGNSPTEGVVYSWTGPGGFNSDLPTATVYQPGLYTLTVFNPNNGCSSTAAVTVTSEGNEPGATAMGGTLSATQPEVELQGGSPTPGVSYNWFGPGGFTSTEQYPVVQYPGFYILTVFDPVSGCVSVAIADVDQVQDECILINLALYLEGAYKSEENRMSALLNTHRGLLPGQIPANPLVTPTPAGNPYREAPWHYEGTNAEETYAGPYINEEGLAVTDWILVSFRTSPHPEDQFLQANALLYEDGHIEFIEPCLLTSSGPSSIWVMVEHRNHVGVLSNSAILVQDNVLVYDFRETDSYSTIASFGQKQILPGVYSMFAADGNQFDFPGFDINGSDNFIWQQQNGQFDSYMSGDFNLNGDVNGADNFLFNANNGIFSTIQKD